MSAGRAGIASASLTALIAFCLLILTGCTTAPDGPPAPVTPTIQTTQLTDVAAGDCYDPAEPDTVVLIDCSEPHAFEVFASFVQDGPSYPGTALDATASEQCERAFGTFVGVEFAASELVLRYVKPSRATWEQGDREVLCAVAEPSGAATGTLAGAAR